MLFNEISMYVYLSFKQNTMILKHITQFKQT